MAFDVGQGLSEMGKTVATTMGVAAIEAQRGELEKQRLQLANELAIQREDKQRVFQAGEAEKQRVFTAGEGDKERASRLEATKISAGASVASARISADASLRGRQMEIDAMKDVRAAQVEAQKVATAGAQLDNEIKTAQRDARKELQEATESGDQAKIAAAKAKVAIYDEGAALRTQQARSLEVETESKALKNNTEKLIQEAKDDLLKAAGNDPAKVAEAKRKIAILESSSKEDRSEIALWQQQAKIAETAMAATMAKLTALQNANPGGMMTPESQATEAFLKKMLTQQEREYRAAAQQAMSLLNELAGNKGGAGTVPTGKEAADLTKYLKGVNPPGEKPKPNRGLINAIPPGAP